MQATVPTLLDIEELSRVIALAPQTIKNLLSKNPSSLPPRVCIPGVKSVRFHSDDVVNWIKNLQRSFQSAQNALANTQAPTTPKKSTRGRPRKSEIIARRYQEQSTESV